MALFDAWKNKSEMKKYVLFFRNVSSLFWKKTTQVSLRSYKVDQRWEERMNKDLTRARLRKENFQELNLTKSQEKELRWISSINQEDIKLILDVVYDTLATWDWFSKVKETILQTRTEIDYNKIILILLDQWVQIQNILNMLDFPNKSEIMEILDSWDRSESKYNKIEKVLFFQDVQNSIKRTFYMQVWQLTWYLVFISWVILAMKFMLFPLIETKLVWWFWLDREILLWDSIMFIWLFVKLVIVLLTVASIFLFLFIFLRERFYQVLFKMPWIRDILLYWNTLKLLMSFSFNYNFNIKFRQKVSEIVNVYFKIPENQSIQEIWMIVSSNYKEIKKKYWIKFFDPLVSTSLDTLSSWTSDVIERIVDKKINLYIRKMREKQEIISSLLKTVTLILVWWAIFTMLLSVMTISFNAMKAAQAWMK